MSVTSLMSLIALQPVTPPKDLLLTITDDSYDWPLGIWHRKHSSQQKSPEPFSCVSAVGPQRNGQGRFKKIRGQFAGNHQECQKLALLARLLLVSPDMVRDMLNLEGPCSKRLEENENTLRLEQRRQ